MIYRILTSQFFLPLFIVSIGLANLTACQKNSEPSNGVTQQTTTKQATTQKTPSQNQALANTDTSSGLAGCYTVSKTEPAQIKINLDNGNYTMQMREFNDPDKPWDKPEPMQVLPKSDIKTYFDVEEKAVEQAIARPDHVFVLAQTGSSLTSLDPRFDSPYLGYIYKGSNTVYKVKCEK